MKHLKKLVNSIIFFFQNLYYKYKTRSIKELTLKDFDWMAQYLRKNLNTKYLLLYMNPIKKIKVWLRPCVFCFDKSIKCKHGKATYYISKKDIENRYVFYKEVKQ